jgi:hypothetical protein
MNQFLRERWFRAWAPLLPLFLLCLFLSTPAAGQTQKQTAKIDQFKALRSTAAYSEVLLRETELKAEVESLAGEYTDEYPKVKESRFALGLIQKEKARLLTTNPAEAEKLTLSLGKLMVRKVDADVELWRLQQSLADNHPDVKRAKKKVEVFEAAIKEILG